MAILVGRLEADGTVRMMTPKIWASVTDSWYVTKTTPVDVADMLNTVRLLYVHGVYVYEFATLAIQQALVTLEAAFAHRLNRPDDTFGALIQQARKQGLIDSGEYDDLYRAARRLRNGFGHSRAQTLMSPGMVVPMIRRVYKTIAHLWPDDSEATHGD
ncbi:MAG TPA: hypothetical protein VN108_02470 [Marmoricola sp.]|nr:hypothetical protein [Marmoricola sp.]